MSMLQFGNGGCHRRTPGASRWRKAFSPRGRYTSATVAAAGGRSRLWTILRSFVPVSDTGHVPPWTTRPIPVRVSDTGRVRRGG